MTKPKSPNEFDIFAVVQDLQRRVRILESRKYGGTVALVKAGVPVDGDFASTPSDGTLALDETNNRLYIREDGVWRFAGLT